MIILSAEIFHKMVRLIAPKSLENLLVENYRHNKFAISSEIIACPGVTKEMVASLFAVSYPRCSGLMLDFFKKCTANELFSELINKAKIDSKFWEEPVVKDDVRGLVVFKVLSEILNKPCVYEDTLKIFINSTVVELEDVRFLIKSQWKSNSNVYTIINCAKPKFSIGALLETQSTKELQQFVHYCESISYELHKEVLEFLKAQENSTVDAPEHKGVGDFYDYEGISTTGVSSDHADDPSSGFVT